MKNVKKFLMIFAAVLVGLVLFRNPITKMVVENVAGIVTGLKLDIGKLNIGLFSGSIDIKDIKLHNSKKFEDPIMVNIPRILVDIQPLSILKGKVHVKDMRFDMAEFYVIKNKDGEANLNDLKQLSKKDTDKKEKKPESKKSDKKQEVQIENVTLKIGKVIFKDYSGEGAVKTKEFNINLNENYKNIENLGVVVSMIVVKVMTKTALAGVMSVDLGGLENVAKDALGSATKALDTTKETFKEATDGLKGILKNPLKN